MMNNVYLIGVLMLIVTIKSHEVHGKYNDNQNEKHKNDADPVVEKQNIEPESIIHHEQLLSKHFDSTKSNTRKSPLESSESKKLRTRTKLPSVNDELSNTSKKKITRYYLPGSLNKESFLSNPGLIPRYIISKEFEQVPQSTRKLPTLLSDDQLDEGVLNKFSNIKYSTLPDYNDVTSRHIPLPHPIGISQIAYDPISEHEPEGKQKTFGKSKSVNKSRLGTKYEFNPLIDIFNKPYGKNAKFRTISGPFLVTPQRSYDTIIKKNVSKIEANPHLDINTYVGLKTGTTNPSAYLQSDPTNYHPTNTLRSILQQSKTFAGKLPTMVYITPSTSSTLLGSDINSDPSKMAKPKIILHRRTNAVNNIKSPFLKDLHLQTDDLANDSKKKYIQITLKPHSAKNEMSSTTTKVSDESTEIYRQKNKKENVADLKYANNDENRTFYIHIPTMKSNAFELEKYLKGLKLSDSSTEGNLHMFLSDESPTSTKIDLQHGKIPTDSETTFPDGTEHDLMINKVPERNTLKDEVKQKSHKKDSANITEVPKTTEINNKLPNLEFPKTSTKANVDPAYERYRLILYNLLKTGKLDQQKLRLLRNLIRIYPRGISAAKYIGVPGNLLKSKLSLEISKEEKNEPASNNFILKKLPHTGKSDEQKYNDNEDPSNLLKLYVGSATQLPDSQFTERNRGQKPPFNSHSLFVQETPKKEPHPVEPHRQFLVHTAFTKDELDEKKHKVSGNPYVVYPEETSKHNSTTEVFIRTTRRQPIQGTPESLIYKFQFPAIKEYNSTVSPNLLQQEQKPLMTFDENEENQSQQIRKHKRTNNIQDTVRDNNPTKESDIKFLTVEPNKESAKTIIKSITMFNRPTKILVREYAPLTQQTSSDFTTFVRSPRNKHQAKVPAAIVLHKIVDKKYIYPLPESLSTNNLKELSIKPAPSENNPTFLKYDVDSNSPPKLFKSKLRDSPNISVSKIITKDIPEALRTYIENEDHKPNKETTNYLIEEYFGPANSISKEQIPILEKELKVIEPNTLENVQYKENIINRRKSEQIPTDDISSENDIGIEDEEPPSIKLNVDITFKKIPKDSKIEKILLDIEPTIVKTNDLYRVVPVEKINAEASNVPLEFEVSKSIKKPTVNTTTATGIKNKNRGINRSAPKFYKNISNRTSKQKLSGQETSHKLLFDIPSSDIHKSSTRITPANLTREKEESPFGTVKVASTQSKKNNRANLGKKDKSPKTIEKANDFENIPKVNNNKIGSVDISPISNKFENIGREENHKVPSNFPENSLNISMERENKTKMNSYPVTTETLENLKSLSPDTSTKQASPNSFDDTAFRHLWTPKQPNISSEMLLPVNSKENKTKIPRRSQSLLNETPKQTSQAIAADNKIKENISEVHNDTHFVPLFTTKQSYVPTEALVKSNSKPRKNEINIGTNILSTKVSDQLNTISENNTKKVSNNPPLPHLLSPNQSDVADETPKSVEGKTNTIYRPDIKKTTEQMSEIVVPRKKMEKNKFIGINETIFHIIQNPPKHSNYEPADTNHTDSYNQSKTNSSMNEIKKPLVGFKRNETVYDLVSTNPTFNISKTTIKKSIVPSKIVRITKMNNKVSTNFVNHKKSLNRQKDHEADTLPDLKNTKTTIKSPNYTSNDELKDKNFKYLFYKKLKQNDNGTEGVQKMTIQKPLELILTSAKSEESKRRNKGIQVFPTFRSFGPLQFNLTEKPIIENNVENTSTSYNESVNVSKPPSHRSKKPTRKSSSEHLPATEEKQTSVNNNEYVSSTPFNLSGFQVIKPSLNTSKTPSIANDASKLSSSLSSKMQKINKFPETEVASTPFSTEDSFVSDTILKQELATKKNYEQQTVSTESYDLQNGSRNVRVSNNNKQKTPEQKPITNTPTHKYRTLTTEKSETGTTPNPEKYANIHEYSVLSRPITNTPTPPLVKIDKKPSNAIPTAANIRSNLQAVELPIGIKGKENTSSPREDVDTELSSHTTRKSIIYQATKKIPNLSSFSQKSEFEEEKPLKEDKKIRKENELKFKEKHFNEPTTSKPFGTYLPLYNSSTEKNVINPSNTSNIQRDFQAKEDPSIKHETTIHQTRMSKDDKLQIILDKVLKTDKQILIKFKPYKTDFITEKYVNEQQESSNNDYAHTTTKTPELDLKSVTEKSIKSLNISSRTENSTTKSHFEPATDTSIKFQTSSLPSNKSEKSITDTSFLKTQYTFKPLNVSENVTIQKNIKIRQPPAAQKYHTANVSSQTQDANSELKSLNLNLPSVTPTSTFSDTIVTTEPIVNEIKSTTSNLRHGFNKETIPKVKQNGNGHYPSTSVLPFYTSANSTPKNLTDQSIIHEPARIEIKPTTSNLRQGFNKEAIPKVIEIKPTTSNIRHGFNKKPSPEVKQNQTVHYPSVTSLKSTPENITNQIVNTEPLGIETKPTSSNLRQEFNKEAIPEVKQNQNNNYTSTPGLPVFTSGDSTPKNLNNSVVTTEPLGIEIKPTSSNIRHGFNKEPTPEVKKNQTVHYPSVTSVKFTPENITNQIVNAEPLGIETKPTSSNLRHAFYKEAIPDIKQNRNIYYLSTPRSPVFTSGDSTSENVTNPIVTTEPLEIEMKPTSSKIRHGFNKEPTPELKHNRNVHYPRTSMLPLVTSVKSTPENIINQIVNAEPLGLETKPTSSNLRHGFNKEAIPELKQNRNVQYPSTSVFPFSTSENSTPENLTEKIVLNKPVEIKIKPTSSDIRHGFDKKVIPKAKHNRNVHYPSMSRLRLVKSVDSVPAYDTNQIIINKTFEPIGIETKPTTSNVRHEFNKEAIFEVKQNPNVYYPRNPENLNNQIALSEPTGIDIKPTTSNVRHGFSKEAVPKVKHNRNVYYPSTSRLPLVKSVDSVPANETNQIIMNETFEPNGIETKPTTSNVRHGFNKEAIFEVKHNPNVYHLRNPEHLNNKIALSEPTGIDIKPTTSNVRHGFNKEAIFEVKHNPNVHRIRNPEYLNNQIALSKLTGTEIKPTTSNVRHGFSKEAVPKVNQNRNVRYPGITSMLPFYTSVYSVPDKLTNQIVINEPIGIEIKPTTSNVRHGFNKEEISEVKQNPNVYYPSTSIPSYKSVYSTPERLNNQVFIREPMGIEIKPTTSNLRHVFNKEPIPKWQKSVTNQVSENFKPSSLMIKLPKTTSNLRHLINKEPIPKSQESVTNQVPENFKPSSLMIELPKTTVPKFSTDKKENNFEFSSDQDDSTISDKGTNNIRKESIISQDIHKPEYIHVTSKKILPGPTELNLSPKVKTVLPSPNKGNSRTTDNFQNKSGLLSYKTESSLTERGNLTQLPEAKSIDGPHNLLNTKKTTGQVEPTNEPISDQQPKLNIDSEKLKFKKPENVQTVSLKPTKSDSENTRKNEFQLSDKSGNDLPTEGLSGKILFDTNITPKIQQTPVRSTTLNVNSPLFELVSEKTATEKPSNVVPDKNPQTKKEMLKTSTFDKLVVPEIVKANESGEKDKLYKPFSSPDDFMADSIPENKNKYISPNQPEQKSKELPEINKDVRNLTNNKSGKPLKTINSKFSNSVDDAETPKIQEDDDFKEVTDKLKNTEPIYKTGSKKPLSHDIPLFRSRELIPRIIKKGKNPAVQINDKLPLHKSEYAKPEKSVNNESHEIEIIYTHPNTNKEQVKTQQSSLPFRKSKNSKEDILNEPPPADTPSRGVKIVVKTYIPKGKQQPANDRVNFEIKNKDYNTPHTRAGFNLDNSKGNKMSVKPYSAKHTGPKLHTYNIYPNPIPSGYYRKYLPRKYAPRVLFPNRRIPIALNGNYDNFIPIIAIGPLPIDISDIPDILTLTGLHAPPIAYPNLPVTPPLTDPLIVPKVPYYSEISNVYLKRAAPVIGAVSIDRRKFMSPTVSESLSV